MKTGAIVAVLASVASALPGLPKLDDNAMKLYNKAKRQADAAAAAGLTDLDIANFALTLEWLEANFYQDCIAQLGVPAFQQAGFSQEQIDSLVKVGQTEFEHASFLQGVIAQGGSAPVQECTYNFPCSSVQEMAIVANVLETVGVSAYAGAAALVRDAGVLSAAATILSIEARHSTLLRDLAGLEPVPNAFDATLTPQQVFTLAAPFVASCPEGSNIAITPNPTLTLVNAPAGQAVAINSLLQVQAETQGSATHCAFVAGGVANGILFTPLDQAAGCTVPQGIAGIAYVMLTNAAPLDGALADGAIVAGPAAFVVT